ncbi:MAG: 2-C-methyl-D-erythritol 4-phosphate cytidylyltransferase [Bacteroidales bacterium]
MKKYVIVVAGGDGKRMRSGMPKQFLCIGGIPILMRSIKAFHEYEKTISIILVLPKGKIGTWQKLCKTHKFIVPHTITAGGSTRFQSVKNGLALIMENDSLVAIHDGVRPLVSREVIQRVFFEGARHGTAVPCVKLNDSLRMLTGNISAPLKRDQICAIQTPQCFRCNILKKAYKQKYNERFTDDATVVENLNEKIYMVEGNAENIKITTRVDLAVAKALLNFKKDADT